MWSKVFERWVSVARKRRRWLVKRTHQVTFSSVIILIRIIRIPNHRKSFSVLFHLFSTGIIFLMSRFSRLHLNYALFMYGVRFNVLTVINIIASCIWQQIYYYRNNKLNVDGCSIVSYKCRMVPYTAIHFISTKFILKTM